MLKIKPRLYQEKIFSTALKGNTLVVLPTGMGKTLLAIMVGLARSKKGRVLFLSPTKPLVEQHARTIEEATDIRPAVLHGNRRFEKRKEDWQAQWIVATPQTVERDMLRGVPIEDFSLVVFDEAHRATGEYAYTHIAKYYMERAKDPLILALTASPGNTPEKIQEVMDNLAIKQVEVRTEKDPDVRPYVRERFLNWVPVRLSREYGESVVKVKNVLRTYLRALKSMGYIQSADLSLLKKRDLLKVDAKGDFDAMSALAAAFKALHALELIELQGPEAYARYLERLRKDRTRAARELIQQLPPPPEEPHPKVAKLVELLRKSPLPAIVFANYRDQVEHILTKLNERGIRAARFVGQKEGMTQKKQREIVELFRSGEHDVLVSTSVGEEGIDLPSVGTLVFYEPVPSGIRHIQRRGRLRQGGRVYVLITQGTREEGYYYAALARERKMVAMLRRLRPSKVLQKKLVPDGRHIIVDDRELAVAKHLSNPKVQRIEVGDFIISDRVAVERKTAHDFVSSIVDGRLFQQASQLREHYEKPLIIVEGGDIYGQRNVHPNAIKGALLSLLVDWGIPVVFTENMEETAQFLELLSKREWEKGREPSVQKARALTLDERQERLVASLPGINLKLAKRLLGVFGSPLSVFNATLYELMSVEGIGSGKASEIKKVLESEYGGEEDY